MSGIEGLSCRAAARCLAAPEPAVTDCASRRRSGAFGLTDASQKRSFVTHHANGLPYDLFRILKRPPYLMRHYFEARGCRVKLMGFALVVEKPAQVDLALVMVIHRAFTVDLQRVDLV
jgi:hypothetical protein